MASIPTISSALNTLAATPAAADEAAQTALFDELDRVLARHYGLTDEELDFILNYDIKYRMGRDGVGGEEGEE
ncbi:MAG: hypothetical protein HYU66_11365 [Armatimonadetes bacterium]|nr:hypothetical protein [Armatimonadota bacterium]